jgi:hypothetical protein
MGNARDTGYAKRVYRNFQTHESKFTRDKVDVNCARLAGWPGSIAATILSSSLFSNFDFPTFPRSSKNSHIHKASTTGDWRPGSLLVQLLTIAAHAHAPRDICGPESESTNRRLKPRSGVALDIMHFGSFREMLWSTCKLIRDRNWCFYLAALIKAIFSE